MIAIKRTHLDSGSRCVRSEKLTSVKVETLSWPATITLPSAFYHIILDISSDISLIS